MKKIKDDILAVALLLVLLAEIWVIGTSAIYAFNNPEKTQTQIIFHAFKSATLDFSN